MGILLAGVFSSTNPGLCSGFGFNADAGVTRIAGQLGVPAIGVAATLIYTAVATCIISKIVDAVVGLSVSKEEETEGLDIVLHEEKDYNL